MKILRASSVAKLKAELQNPKQIELYDAPGEFLGLGGAEFHEAVLTLGPAPTLDQSGAAGAPSNDAANAQLIHEWLVQLSPRQAADERLWVSLAHLEFYRYVFARWNEPRTPSYITQHWFISGRGLAGLRRNAIARLWWAAHLTFAPWQRDASLGIFEHSDVYHHTKILLSSQQVFQDLIEREFGSNRLLRICFLHALDKHLPGPLSRDKLVRAASVRLRLLLNHTHLAGLSASATLAAVTSLMDEITEGSGV